VVGFKIYKQVAFALVITPLNTLSRPFFSRLNTWSVMETENYFYHLCFGVAGVTVSLIIFTEGAVKRLCVVPPTLMGRSLGGHDRWTHGQEGAMVNPSMPVLGNIGKRLSTGSQCIHSPVRGVWRYQQ